MSLEKCRECAEQVSSEATICPKCGIKNPVRKKPIGCVGILIALAVVVAIGMLAGQQPNASINSSPKETYMRCLAKHTGEEPSKWHYPYGMMDSYFNKECEDEMNAYLRFDEECKKNIDLCISYTSLLPVIAVGAHAENR